MKFIEVIIQFLWGRQKYFFNIDEFKSASYCSRVGDVQLIFSNKILDAFSKVNMLIELKNFINSSDKILTISLEHEDVFYKQDKPEEKLPVV